MVLEYVPGQTLRQRVQKDGPLSESEVVRLTRSICDVLEYLHNFDPPIVHRDVTPENILVLPDGSIKLIDFSLAVKMMGAAPLTHAVNKHLLRLSNSEKKFAYKATFMGLVLRCFSC